MPPTKMNGKMPAPAPSPQRPKRASAEGSDAPVANGHKRETEEEALRPKRVVKPKTIKDAAEDEPAAPTRKKGGTGANQYTVRRGGGGASQRSPNSAHFA